MHLSEQEVKETSLFRAVDKAWVNISNHAFSMSSSPARHDMVRNVRQRLLEHVTTWYHKDELAFDGRPPSAGDTMRNPLLLCCSREVVKAIGDLFKITGVEGAPRLSAIAAAQQAMFEAIHAELNHLKTEQIRNFGTMNRRL